MIRKAKLDDIRQCAELTYMSGPNVFKYIFNVPEERILQILMMMFDQPRTFLSKEYFWIHEEESKVRGLAVIFSGGVKTALEKNMSKYGRNMMKYMSIPAMIKLMLHSRMFKKLPSIGADEMYIANLAVSPNYRRKGVATALLQKAFAWTKESGLSKTSLLVELENEKAVKAYEKNGFSIVETRELPTCYRRHNLIGFHKMTAVVA